jgi:hypothetical protein
MTVGWAGLPRTSTAGSTPRSDTGSMGSADVRTSPGRRGAAWRRSFPRAWPLWEELVRVRAGAAKSKGKGRAGRTPVAEADGALDCLGDGHGGGLVVGVGVVVGGVAGCGQDASRCSWALSTRSSVRSHVAGAKMLGGPLAPGRVHLARPTPDERAARLRLARIQHQDQRAPRTRQLLFAALFHLRVLARHASAP